MGCAPARFGRLGERPMPRGFLAEGAAGHRRRVRARGGGRGGRTERRRARRSTRSVGVGARRVRGACGGAGGGARASSSRRGRRDARGRAWPATRRRGHARWQAADQSDGRGIRRRGRPIRNPFAAAGPRADAQRALVEMDGFAPNAGRAGLRRRAARQLWAPLTRPRPPLPQRRPRRDEPGGASTARAPGRLDRIFCPAARRRRAARALGRLGEKLEPDAAVEEDALARRTTRRITGADLANILNLAAPRAAADGAAAVSARAVSDARDKVIMGLPRTSVAVLRRVPGPHLVPCCRSRDRRESPRRRDAWRVEKRGDCPSEGRGRQAAVLSLDDESMPSRFDAILAQLDVAMGGRAAGRGSPSDRRR